MQDITISAHASAPEPRASRRHLLRLAGAAAVTGTAASMLTGGVAEATTGTMQFGTSNDAGAAQTTLTSVANGPTFAATNTAGNTMGIGVRGNVSGGGTALYGQVSSPAKDAWGVYGGVVGDVGYALVGQGGQAQLLLHGGVEVPTTSSIVHQAGEVLRDVNDVIWVCVASGTPGAWRSVASPATAGAFYPISPSRVYDSRKPSSNPLATGQSRTVSVADRIDVSTGVVVQTNVVPAGATAISYNVTVVNTVGTNGYLAINEGGNAVVAASIINWSAAGLTLANSSQVKLNGSRQITVICGGSSTSTNFVIDVVGYYR